MDKLTALECDDPSCEYWPEDDGDLYCREEVDSVVQKLELRIVELEQLSEKFKQEAIFYSSESKCHKSTVHECYQAVGAQKGTWNGAKPVVEFVEKANKRIAELEVLVKKEANMPLLKRIHADIKKRGTTDSDGFLVVDLSDELWRRLCLVTELHG